MKHFASVFVLSFAACAAPTATPDLHGLSVNDSELQEVFGYIDTYGPIAFNKAAASPLSGLTSLTFVNDIFSCGTLDGNEMCLGLTLTSDQAVTTVAMVKDTYGDEPTNDVRCTSLAHELAHVVSWELTGDPDPHHSNFNLWGSYGLVQSALNELCPGLQPRPQNRAEAPDVRLP